MPIGRLRLGVDIGGTFTDSVVIDDKKTVLAEAKTLTTHDDPTEGAMAGIASVLAQADISLKAINVFVHGTTLAANALIEKRGARVATVATEGFRDILEIANERRYNQYDLTLTKPDYLVPRDRSFTIRERMSVSGEPLLALDEDAVPQLVSAIEQCGAEAVAVCFLHSYANPAHEQRLRDLLQEALPDLTISISSDISQEAREFDRMCTTAANAYIRPMMEQYLRAFETRLRDAGLLCPILLMASSGGMCGLDVATLLPIRLLESGPAGGAEFATWAVGQHILDYALSFDMGGTTAKLCLIHNLEPQNSRSFEVARKERFLKGSGIPVRISAIDMIEIGAGGGSIASIDHLGRLTVGPESAGSNPGPAGFDRGGGQPTVTDADIVLGYVAPESFAEGQIQIDRDAAHSAIEMAIGTPLGLETDEVADAICRMVDESMASAARMHAAESGRNLDPYTLVAYGGNGPLHACRVARLAGIFHVMVPPNPGVGSAVGFLTSRISYDSVRSCYTLLSSIDFDKVNDLLKSMEEQATAIVRQGAPEGMIVCQTEALMRYRGQGHEIMVYVPRNHLTEENVHKFKATFEERYAEKYSRPVKGMEIEIPHWYVHVSTTSDFTYFCKSRPLPRDVQTDSTRQIRCDVTGQYVEARVYRREDLQPGDALPGPALITEPQTTTFVGADFSAKVDAYGNLMLTREGAPKEELSIVQALVAGGLKI